MHPDLLKSLTATPAEQDAHLERTSPELSRWSHLEYERRVADRQSKELLRILDGEKEPEFRELLAYVIAIGATHIADLEREKDKEPAGAAFLQELRRRDCQADSLTKLIHELWPDPGPICSLMIQVLEAARARIKTTLDANR